MRPRGRKGMPSEIERSPQATEYNGGRVRSDILRAERWRLSITFKATDRQSENLVPALSCRRTRQSCRWKVPQHRFLHTDPVEYSSPIKRESRRLQLNFDTQLLIHFPRLRTPTRRAGNAKKSGFVKVKVKVQAKISSPVIHRGQRSTFLVES